MALCSVLPISLLSEIVRNALHQQLVNITGLSAFGIRAKAGRTVVGGYCFRAADHTWRVKFGRRVAREISKNNCLLNISDVGSVRPVCAVFTTNRN